jgi:prepilin-type N-terminal cleavage/methylation domain-containing protein
MSLNAQHQIKSTGKRQAGLPTGKAGFTLIELPVVRKGFTLIELLVVIAIIALLVGILAPAITRAIAMGYNAKSVAGMQELNSGAMGYYKSNNCYPGQKYKPKTDGMGTGSQVLAACIFGDLNGNGTLKGTATSPSDGYVSWKSDKTAIIEGEAWSLTDRFPDPKAFMYFPSDPGNNGSTVATAFTWGNNSAYTSETGAQTKFQGTNDGDPNWNSKMGVAQKYDTYLIIGPGIDRYYYTDDDSKDAYSDNVTNF